MTSMDLVHQSAMPGETASGSPTIEPSANGFLVRSSCHSAFRKSSEIVSRGAGCADASESTAIAAAAGGAGAGDRLPRLLRMLLLRLFW